MAVLPFRLMFPPVLRYPSSPGFSTFFIFHDLEANIRFQIVNCLMFGFVQINRQLVASCV